MRRANVILAAALAVGGLVALGGCGMSADEGEKIDLSEQYVTKPKKPVKPIPDENLSPRQRRLRKAAETNSGG